MLSNARNTVESVFTNHVDDSTKAFVASESATAVMDGQGDLIVNEITVRGKAILSNQYPGIVKDYMYGSSNGDSPDEDTQGIINIINQRYSGFSNMGITDDIANEFNKPLINSVHKEFYRLVVSVCSSTNKQPMQYDEFVEASMECFPASSGVSEAMVQSKIDLFRMISGKLEATWQNNVIPELYTDIRSYIVRQYYTE